MLVDDFLPWYDVSDAVATLVHADLDTTWAALVDADLIAVGRRHPLVGVLGALRALPMIATDLLHGEGPQSPPAIMRLHDAARVPPAEGGWVLLGERVNDEIALGMIGKFWRPVIEFADVPPDQFQAFAVPGFAKTIYALSVKPAGAGRTMLTGTMRTATTDESAQRWFRRYWTFGVGSGAHALVHGLLDCVREAAERVAPAYGRTR